MSKISARLSRHTGQRYENTAKVYLQQQGLQFHSQNYHCQGGEIDLIMRDQQQWVFVEVKFRSRQDFGSAVEYFHPQKRKKILHAMKHFMHSHHLNPAMVSHRIDLVAIDANDLQWFKCV